MLPLCLFHLQPTNSGMSQVVTQGREKVVTLITSNGSNMTQVVDTVASIKPMKCPQHHALQYQKTPFVHSPTSRSNLCSLKYP